MKRVIFTFLSIFVLLSTILHAEVPTKESITKLYVATFNRAPDAAGLNYWLNDSGLQLEQIAQSFFDQPETKALYPSSTSNQDFIKAVYSNLFNRDPDTAGWSYWEGELNSGHIKKSVFILAAMNGALGSDTTILENKKRVGIAYVESGLNNTQWAKEVMADVTIEEQSVTVAMERIESFKNNKDKDNDYIPDSIEMMLGMDPDNPDEDEDGTVDGLQSTGSHGDTFFDKQWYIRSTGQIAAPDTDPTIPGNDLNLMDVYHKYMGYNNGDPLIVQVVDTGIDTDHEDLRDNMDLSLSRNSFTHTMGDPIEAVDSDHGTMVAGIIAARAFNGKGVRGVAPFVKIAGSNWMSVQSYVELEEVWTRNDHEGKIVLSNNNFALGLNPHTFDEELMAYASDNLRIIDGIPRGKLFIKPVPNDRNTVGAVRDANLNYNSSNPYVISVGAVGNDNTYASYSSPGSNLFVSGYSAGNDIEAPSVATTYISTQASSDLDDIVWWEANRINKCFSTRISDGACTVPTWPEDSTLSYTYNFSGTCAATPMVSGVLVLVLEACPTLSWRDVKYLIAKNAIKVDAENSSWATNTAGFHHSVDYGFGLINAGGMIQECQSGYTPLPVSRSFAEHFNLDPDGIIPDNDPVGRIDHFIVTQNSTIEWLAVTLVSDHTWAADLEIYLTSPAGTTTRLVKGKNGAGNYSMGQGFRYGSVAFMGELSAGRWTLKIADLEAPDTGKLKSYKFQVFGH